MQSQADVSATDLNLRHLEIAVSDTADGKAHNTSSSPLCIDNLPDEILIKILSYMSFNELIDVVQNVCSRWRRLSQDVELWADKECHITYWTFYDSHTRKGVSYDQEAVQTFRSAPNLLKVTMHRGAKSRVFRELYTRCCKLSELRLHSSQKLSHKMLKHLVEGCPRLHTLSISNELLKSEKFSEVVSRLQHLRLLQLVPYNSEIPALRPLADGCSQLAEVNFETVTLDVEELRYFLTAKKNTLKSIGLKWVMAGRWCVVPLLAICADSLERLQLYDSDIVDYDIVDYDQIDAFTALRSLKNLQELRTALVNPTPPGVAALTFRSGALSKLRLLDLQSQSILDNGALIIICRQCPVLWKLMIVGATLLSDAAFSEVYRLEHLEILWVSNCKGLGGALIPYLTGIPRLHTLVMHSVEFPELQPGLSSILELSSLRCLTLDFSTITGVPFDKFPGRLVCLRELNVEWCRGDPKATDGLAEKMPGLKIHGTIYPEECHTNIADEENEENAVPGNEAEVQNSDSDSDSTYLNENDGDSVIWDESSIHILFLDQV